MDELIYMTIGDQGVRFDYIVTAGDVANTLLAIAIVVSIWVVMFIRRNQKWRK